MKVAMLNKKQFAGVLLLSVLIAACSDSPKTEAEKKPERPPEPVTGRQAFQMMYPQARRWAADAEPLQLRSVNLAQVKSEKGKAGAWQAVFVSPSQAKARTYSYSAVEAGGSLHEGVFPGQEEAYSGTSGSTPFSIAAIKIDSDQAYETAAKQSAEYTRKNAGKPVSFLLEQNKRFADVSWRVIWGESVGTSDYSVFVDASTGAYLATAH